MYKLFAINDDQLWADRMFFAEGRTHHSPGGFVFRSYKALDAALLLDPAWRGDEYRVLVRTVLPHGAVRHTLSGHVTYSTQLEVGPSVICAAPTIEARLDKMLIYVTRYSDTPAYWKQWAADWRNQGRDRALMVAHRISLAGRAAACNAAFAVAMWLDETVTKHARVKRVRNVSARVIRAALYGSKKKRNELAATAAAAGEEGNGPG